MAILDFLLGWLAPHECLGCGGEGSLLCSACAADLPLAQGRAVTIYRGVGKDLVWRLKFDSAQAAAQVMAQQMLRLLPNTGILIPVPTTTLRRRQRGYDQAALLARELSKLSGLPMRHWLARSGRQHQIGANRAQRLAQLEQVFRLNRHAQPHGKRIILVDDVATTGATLEAAAKALRAGGAARVTAITFAQA